MMPGFGELTTDHLVPSQCSIRVPFCPFMCPCPTAQTSRDPAAETANKAAPLSQGPIGAWVDVQLCPSQCSVSKPSCDAPTAQMSEAEIDDAPNKEAPTVGPGPHEGSG